MSWESQLLEEGDSGNERSLWMFHSYKVTSANSAVPSKSVGVHNR